MKIDTNTVNILKNFAKINPSIIIQEGNTLKTISTSKTVMAKAQVQTSFDKRFAIYNLDSFIANLSMFNDPEVKLGDAQLVIREGNLKQVIPFADESAIKAPPEKEINLPSIDVSFTLSQDHFKKIEKAAGINSLPEMVIVGDGSKLYLQADDTKLTNGNTFSIEVGETTKTFKAIFKLENIKIIPGDYEVSICSRGISHFSGKEAEYWIAVEQSSTF
jgi:hypothetical protein